MISRALQDEAGTNLRLERQLPSFKMTLAVTTPDGTSARYIASADDMRTLAQMLVEAALATERLGK
jgi:hypothetical protein